MTYTERSGMKVHVIDNPLFASLMNRAEPLEYSGDADECGRALSDELERMRMPVLERFFPEEVTEWGSNEWEQQAWLYDWTDDAFLMETRMVFLGSGTPDLAPRHWEVPKE